MPARSRSRLSSPCSPAATAQADGPWQALGESPATGQGVFRFPQALAYAPGGRQIFVGDRSARSSSASDARYHVLADLLYSARAS